MQLAIIAQPKTKKPMVFLKPPKFSNASLGLHFVVRLSWIELRNGPLDITNQGKTSFEIDECCFTTGVAAVNWLVRNSGTVWMSPSQISVGYDGLLL